MGVGGFAMRRIRLAALALCTLAAVVPAAADAGPPTPGPFGSTCGLSASPNPSGEANVYTGAIYGGPLADPNASGTFTCSVQVGANDRHAEADSVSISSSSSAGATFAGPSIVSYTATSDQNVYLCTSFAYAGGSTVYWHGDNTGTGAGHWSTDVNSECKLAISVENGGHLVAPDVIAPDEVTPPEAYLDDRYAAGGTAVGRVGGQTFVDNGGAVCDRTHRAGSGGVCLPFGGGNGVEVLDAVHGQNVAFQVCVDNNHDNICGFSPFDAVGSTTGPCADDIVFSHNDAGAFYNPVGPVPGGFRTGCATPAGSRSWNGYVVMLCEGAHDTHQHPATTGTARVTGSPEGVGTFCGAPDPQPGKFYFVV